MPILSYFPSGGGGEIPVTVPTLPSQKGELVYTGESLTPTWNDYDPEKLTVGGVTSSINAGSYYAIFTPKLGYCWDDLSVEPRQALWTIKKAEGRATASVLSVSLDTVSNKTATFTVARLGDGKITVTSSKTSVATVSLNGSTVTVTSKGVGTAVITVSVAEGTNHTAATVKVDVASSNVWKKYNATHTVSHTLWVPSFECTVEELEDMEDYGDIDWVDDCDNTVEPGTSGQYPTGFGGYDSVSVDSSGNIVAGSSSSLSLASYVRYSYAGANDWYYVGKKDSSGVLYLYELDVLSEDEYAIGSYVGDVLSTNPNAYTDGINSDGYWYVKQ